MTDSPSPSPTPPERKSRSEIKREVLMSGGTMDDAFDEIKAHEGKLQPPTAEISTPKSGSYIAEALEVGLEAGFNIGAGGYLGGNSEQRLRVGILAALKHYADLLGCNPHSPRELFPEQNLDPPIFACRHCEKILESSDVR